MNYIFPTVAIIIAYATAAEGSCSSTCAAEDKYQYSPFINLKNAFALKDKDDIYLWGYYGEHTDNLAKQKGLLIGQKFENVKDIVANDRAFVVIGNDKKMSTYGYKEYGGKYTTDSTVKKVVACGKNFSALLDGSSTAITWGEDGKEETLNGIKDVSCVGNSFAFIKNADNALKLVGEGPEPSVEYMDVKEITGTYDQNAFAIITHGGNLHAWGGIEKSITGHNFTEIVATMDSILVRNSTGSAKAFGRLGNRQFENVTEIFSTRYSFGIKKSDDSVVLWSKFNEKKLEDTDSVVSNEGAFAVLLKDGTVFAWGDENYGGANDGISFCESGDRTGGNSAPFCYKKPENLKNVKDIKATKMSFFALQNNGHVVGWGNVFYGVVEDIKPFPESRRMRRSGIAKLHTIDHGVAMVKTNGQIITKGTYAYDVTIINGAWDYQPLSTISRRHPPTGCVKNNNVWFYIKSDFKVNCQSGWTCTCDNSKRRLGVSYEQSFWSDAFSAIQDYFHWWS
jgi:alpha-tubulin suppressor-like RCC1 family protein